MGCVLRHPAVMVFATVERQVWIAVAAYVASVVWGHGVPSTLTVGQACVPGAPVPVPHPRTVCRTGTSRVWTVEARTALHVMSLGAAQWQALCK